jgi:hypothetical protein
MYILQARGTFSMSGRTKADGSEPYSAFLAAVAGSGGAAIDDVDMTTILIMIIESAAINSPDSCDMAVVEALSAYAPQ